MQKMSLISTSFAHPFPYFLLSLEKKMMENLIEEFRLLLVQCGVMFPFPWSLTSPVKTTWTHGNNFGKGFPSRSIYKIRKQRHSKGKNKRVRSLKFNHLVVTVRSCFGSNCIWVQFCLLLDFFPCLQIECRLVRILQSLSKQLRFLPHQ